MAVPHGSIRATYTDKQAMDSKSVEGVLDKALATAMGGTVIILTAKLWSGCFLCKNRQQRKQMQEAQGSRNMSKQRE